MALTGTITVSTCGMNVGFSTGNAAFRATSLYLYNLTAGTNVWLDITTTSGCTAGYAVPPSVQMLFPQLGGITGFSTIASSAGGSADIAYLASR